MRWKYGSPALLMLVASPAAAQETSVYAFFDQAIASPPRSRADAERLLLNHPLSETHRDTYIRYEGDVRTTDGAVTHAEFREPTHPPFGPGLVLSIRGICLPADEVRRRYPGFYYTFLNHPRAGGPAFLWEHRTETSIFSFSFADDARNCLSTFTVSSSAKPPS